MTTGLFLNGIQALRLTIRQSLVSLTWRHPPAETWGFAFSLRCVVIVFQWSVPLMWTLANCLDPRCFPAITFNGRSMLRWSGPARRNIQQAASRPGLGAKKSRSCAEVFLALI